MSRQGAALASAVVLLLAATVAAHRPIDAPEVEDSAKPEAFLAAHGIGGDALRRRMLSVQKAMEQPLAYGTESLPDAHTRKLQQFISGLIEKRREQDRLEHPGETDLQRFGRKAKKGLNFLMGTFSVVSAVGCFIPGLQFFCATTLLG
eukprot:evm.model.scf_1111.3 EVM.evm.TU.scf_1111.3   scf_1111:46188-49411(+)